jgi:hypothetical protein
LVRVGWQKQMHLVGARNEHRKHGIRSARSRSALSSTRRLWLAWDPIQINRVLVRVYYRVGITSWLEHAPPL